MYHQHVVISVLLILCWLISGEQVLHQLHHSPFCTPFSSCLRENPDSYSECAMLIFGVHTCFRLPFMKQMVFQIISEGPFDLLALTISLLVISYSVYGVVVVFLFFRLRDIHMCFPCVSFCSMEFPTGILLPKFSKANASASATIRAEAARFGDMLFFSLGRHTMWGPLDS